MMKTQAKNTRSFFPCYCLFLQIYRNINISVGKYNKFNMHRQLPLKMFDIVFFVTNKDILDI